MRPADAKTIFCRRLREARTASGLSQKQLGIRSGLDEFVASTRINRYEVGVHEPDIGTMRRLAAVMGVPLPYFYAEDDLLARTILAFSRLPRSRRRSVLGEMESLAEKHRPLITERA
ncbi:MAG: helix-turn-helix transcriptional regulator [Rudaea sp.]|uniref:helix-turn-helix domain-containing protein n=1 Tax=Rudaea sp. TaxID=2136325 RepID=UPI0039E4405D